MVFRFCLTVVDSKIYIEIFRSLSYVHKKDATHLSHLSHPLVLFKPENIRILGIERLTKMPIDPLTIRDFSKNR